MSQVRPSTPVVGESHSVEESLEQLRRLSEGTANGTSLNSGLAYGTIAIQQYRRKDGSRSWLVTIPGTDGQADSPFGWPQNAELMSDERTQRLRADSARMVAEAMRRAGIARDEPVVLVGHSQGGIVAAVVASDMRDRYTVSHVVTAGSPVANHPIDDDTWVTSVEMDDELVASLDGSRNPMRDHWLTVRGTAHPISGTDPTVNDDGSCMPGSKEPSRYYAGSPVVGAPRDKELTHALRYHQAAWNNAKDLGSPALSEHERHFEEIIDGELQETTYWQGRMGH